MNVSPEVDVVLSQIRELREARQIRLQRDLHFIDAEFDRRLRRIREGSAEPRTLWSWPLENPHCIRRYLCRQRRRRKTSVGK